ncbi:hypothetical protein CM240_1943 [Clostridium bornimense]|uniref:Purine nucleoside phosphorylase n=1 Tax=Clostridium bornimense TaxID=1216932 RepID=W6RWP1_9CLOT|nr:peptidoglycan editing factor PgeF [Clostridium bornimense]CDM69101.1 hypothetical protein CM240_1943 [Clostridium bornimense]
MLTTIEGKRFLVEKDDNIDVVISTIDNNFNISSDSFQSNMEFLKKALAVDEIGYSRQIHSTIVNRWDGEIKEGDALVCENKNTAIGVFTADCVPILIYSKNKNVIAAVHSGWRGTFENILKKTIDKIYSCYGEIELNAVIGPHIKKCCYEVSEELIDKFKSIDYLKDRNINNGRNLDLTAIIKIQLENLNVKTIKDLSMCTYCSESIKFHSYRKEKENSGRIFSTIVIR